MKLNFCYICTLLQNISGEKLPTGIDILKHLKARISQLEQGSFTSKQSILYCDSSYVGKCKEGCSCIFSALKQTWRNAGYDILCDKDIKKKLKELDTKYVGLLKNRRRSNSKDVSNQMAFLSDAQKLFDIGVPDLEKRIKDDKNRTEQMKREDLEFLNDQERNKYFST